MEFHQTKKGLLRADFKDRNGQECSVQESSMPGEDCLWLGVDMDSDGRAMRRMHLTREQARKLIPMLRHFVRTGRLGVDEPKEKFQIGAQVIGVGEGNRGTEGRIVELKRGEYMAVQDRDVAGPRGLTICTWAQADLIWVPVEEPEHVPSAFERIAHDD